MARPLFYGRTRDRAANARAMVIPARAPIVIFIISARPLARRVAQTWYSFIRGAMIAQGPSFLFSSPSHPRLLLLLLLVMMIIMMIMMIMMMMMMMLLLLFQ